ncbi:MAG: TolC family protein [Flavobacterium sp.]|nr:TolC family protein [Flavobacterium sp.]
MINNKHLAVIICLLTTSLFFAQQKTSLKLKEAINLAIEKSNEVVLANTKVATKKLELQSVKNNLYPSLKASGQYYRLTNASVDQKNKSTGSSSIPTASPKVNQLMLAQINASLPIFSGFKLRNSIEIADNMYKAENALAENTKEEIAVKVVEFYAELYRAQKSIELLNENLKKSNQRATDFKALEENGIIARNDLLKAQLQIAKVQLSLDEASKNVNIINYELITLLKLPSETQLFVDESEFKNFEMINIPKDESTALLFRKDLEAVRIQEKASENNIKLAKGSYYPNLSLVAGYTALSLQNVVTVKNAINFGLGVSYDFSSIFKNNTEVKIAKNKALEIRQNENLLTDKIKIDVKNAVENYNLALKQNLVYAQAVEQTSENYRIVKDKYDNGLSDTNDLLEADVEDLNAKINQSYTKANIVEKYYQLLSVSGQLTQTINASKN